MNGNLKKFSNRKSMEYEFCQIKYEMKRFLNVSLVKKKKPVTHWSRTIVVSERVKPERGHATGGKTRDSPWVTRVRKGSISLPCGPLLGTGFKQKGDTNCIYNLSKSVLLLM